MATISSSSVTSGSLDVASIVSQLVSAERAPQDKRLARLDTNLTTEFTAISQLKGALSGFQATLAGLKDATTLVGHAASSSDTTVFTASAGAAAAVGTYDLQVVQLAKAAQLTSTPFTGGPTSAVGYGTFTLSVGGNAFTVTLDAAHNTLSDIRNAINASTNNTGVQASILTTTDGSRLILTGNSTGAANAITVTQSGGDGGLSQLVYDPPRTSTLTQTTAAQDAIVNINGFAVHSSTNTVSSALDGVVLTLIKPAASATLTVSSDTTSVLNKVSAFVSAYNTLEKTAASLRSYDATTQQAGPLLGDAMLSNIESQLRRMLTSVVPGGQGGYQTLSSIGVSFGVDGTLSLDTTKFQAALAANPSAVSGLFASSGGLGKQLSDFVDGQLSSQGSFATRQASLDVRRKDLVARQDALNVRMQAFQNRYTKQFTALDSLLTQMQSTSNYLTQQLSQSTTLAKSSGK